MNIDTNVLIYALTQHSEYGKSALQLLEEGTGFLTSASIDEFLVVYTRLHLGPGKHFLAEKDIARNVAVEFLQTYIVNDNISCEDTSLIIYALDVYRFRRLDWVDSYLIARRILYNESFCSFDSDMLKVTNRILQLGGKIPIISGYACDIDVLPAHVVKDAGIGDKMNFVVD